MNDFLDDDEEEEIPNKAKNWKREYEKDDMETLYNPVIDIMTENDILRENNSKFQKVTNVLNCSYCFRRVCFGNFNLISENDIILGFVCRELKDVLIDTQEPKLVGNSDKWYHKFMKIKPLRKNKTKNEPKVKGAESKEEEERVKKILNLEEKNDEFVRDCPDIVFKICCLGCKKELGELHHSKKLYFLENVVQGSG